MIIDCISDLHGEFPTLQGGDMLIVAGDLVGHSTHEAYAYFDEWIGKQGYRFKVVIAGNHDTFIKGFEFKNCTYLEDSGCEFEGLKIWGSPWSAWFHGINPRCKAFTKHNDEGLKKKWDLVPLDTNILITHSPPFGFFDEISRTGENVGSISLKKTIEHIMPEMVIFGHIHEWGGHYIEKEGILYINGSILNEEYRVVNSGRRVNIDEKMPKMQRIKIIE